VVDSLDREHFTELILTLEIYLIFLPNIQPNIIKQMPFINTHDCQSSVMNQGRPDTKRKTTNNEKFLDTKLTLLQI